MDVANRNSTPLGAVIETIYICNKASTFMSCGSIGNYTTPCLKFILSNGCNKALKPGGH